MREYKTKVRLFGLPLVHMAVRSHRSEGPGVARGWIAVGERAFGGVVAVGNVAVGPIAMGGFAIGGLCGSIVAVGGFAVGAIISVGVWTWGGISVGLYAAEGGIAVASQFAEGIVALAQNANDAAAERFFDEALAFSLLRAFLDDWILVLAATALLLIPVGLFHLKTRRKGGQ